MPNPAARIYAIGGQTDGELHVSTVESLGLLDAAAGKWRVETPMPRARTGACRVQGSSLELSDTKVYEP